MALPKRAALAWSVALLGMAMLAMAVFGTASGTTVFSTTRMAVAAALLSLYSSAIAMLAVPRRERSFIRSLIFAGTVPLLIGVATVVVVLRTEVAPTQALLCGLPWLLGVLSAPLFGRVVPALHLPWRRG
ncbi:hypothetical protein CLV29_2700 [Naumannella halotolerans]|uniref:Uncharacterized protein n=2 Tax=Naumannella halotolerans TaxID=993414 RepID=A0A4R7J2N7_9ACTN|nr:hypothetical protein CLV29_2700 [Naumannella halotolerans]